MPSRLGSPIDEMPWITATITSGITIICSGRRSSSSPASSHPPPTDAAPAAGSWNHCPTAMPATSAAKIAMVWMRPCPEGASESDMPRS